MERYAVTTTGRHPRADARLSARAGRVVLLAAALMGGCYRYVPVEPAGLERGAPIRARVSAVPVEVGDVALRDVTRVDGEFVSLAEDRIFLSASWLVNRAGREFDGLGTTVELERGSLDALLEKRLDARNTGLVVAAFAAGAAILHSILDSSGGVSGGGPGGGGGGSRQ